VKASDLTGEAKELFEEWRALGYTERQALDRVERSGVVRESELYENLRGIFGLSREAASMAALGRAPEPLADDRAGLVENFKSSFGLSEQAAQIAADGHDGPSRRPASGSAGRWSAKPEPGDALSMVARVEGLAADTAGRGGSYKGAVKAAVWQLFEAAPNEVWQDWIAGVAGRRWPWLYPNSGSSTAASAKGGKVSETTRQRSAHSFTFEARGC
jgi:hypothetical protein